MAKRKSKGTRGDKPGHPFRGNQYTKGGKVGTRRSVTAVAKVATGSGPTGTTYRRAQAKAYKRGMRKPYGGELKSFKAAAPKPALEKKRAVLKGTGRKKLSKKSKRVGAPKVSKAYKIGQITPAQRELGRINRKRRGN
jgi:hypothetical protein